MKKYKRILVLIAVVLLVQICLQVSLLNFRMPMISVPGLIYRLLSIIVLTAIFGIMYGLSGNYARSLFVFLATFIIIAFLNLLKILYRQEPILPSDLQFLISPLSFFTMVNFIYIVLFVLLVSFLFFALNKIKKHTLDKTKAEKKLAFTQRMVVIVTSIAVLFSYFSFNYRQRPQILANENSRHWDQLQIYDDNTFVMGFAQNLPGPKMQQPTDYSQERVIEIMEYYQAVADQENEKRSRDHFEDISVIFILSESLSDPRRVHGVELNQSPIPYIQDSQDKLRTGQMLSPVYGGGTANTEFEVLTGMSIQNLLPNMSTPYLNFLSDFEHFPSFVDFYKQQDHHKAIAVHAYHSSMFKRKAVFNTLGFDEQYYKNSFKHQDKIDNSDYISDESAYSEVLDILKQNPEQDYFVHLITMQNHSKYTNKYHDQDFKVGGLLSESAKEAVSYYSQGIYYTDEATKEFVSSLRSLDRKVMVVLYGDHLPALYYELKEYNDLYTLSMTDYFILSNFPVNKMYQEKQISPTNLVNEVTALADVKMTAYQALLQDYRAHVPYSKHERYFDQHGRSRTYENLDTESQKITDLFYLIQYDMLEGAQYAKEYFQVKN